MLNWILYGIGFMLLAYYWRKKQRERRLAFIKNYVFSPVLLKRVKEKHNYLSDKDMQKVLRATRDYFHICSQAKGKMVAMPSEIVDVFWHEFILFTREYEQFCKKGIGRFLHHTPTEAMSSKKVAQKGIKRAWRLACAKAGIDPARPVRLPLLFEIDTLLKIKGGFKYQLNCKNQPFNSNSTTSGCGGYCATDIACASGCAGDSGASCGASSGSDSGGGFFSSGSDSSCGGGGCGGGGD